MLLALDEKTLLTFSHDIAISNIKVYNYWNKIAIEGDDIMKIYSVKILLESIVVPNPNGGKTFEETIRLVKAFTKEELEQKVRNYFVDETYENALGGQTTWRFVTILDIFELIDDFAGDIDFKEVYSRFLPFEQLITANEVIELYSLAK